MFEKEAEEYAKEKYDIYEITGRLRNFCRIGETFKDGAEFGYNKAKYKVVEKLNKATEILKVVLNKWKEERWILQSEKEVKMIENVMKETEQFLKEE